MGWEGDTAAPGAAAVTSVPIAQRRTHVCRQAGLTAVTEPAVLAACGALDLVHAQWSL